MERTQIYIPKKLKTEIKKATKAEGGNFSDFVREALKARLETRKHTQQKRGAKILLDMAQRAKQEKAKGPSDLSINVDKYLYGDN